MKNQLTVEIKGIGFPNKGAELMLVAIQQAFEAGGVNARFAMIPNGDYDYRSTYRLYQITSVIRKGIDVGKIFNFLPNTLLAPFGMVRPRDVDVVIDASGFAYGDQWGGRKARNRLGHIAKLRKDGVKVILMPQALGPFDDADTRAAVKVILDNANLVYARDRDSLAYAKQISDASNIRLSADITNQIYGEPFAKFDPVQHQVCFIPNSKMLEKTDLGQTYVDLMVSMVKHAQQQNCKPYFLIHEGEADRQVARDILSRLDATIPVLEHIHPLKIKWIIGQSKVVISSRFHGLVSALSQGVPVIATGWSHKYQRLLEGFGCEQALMEVNEDASASIERLSQLTAYDDMYINERNDLLARAQQLKLEVKAMWQDVFALLSEK